MSAPVDALLAQIEREFRAPHPGDAFLQGSHDGPEPAQEVAALAGCRDWRTLTPSVLDECWSAIGFLSEAGLRFFLPAWLAADVRTQLQTADPAFHLTHGFSELRVATREPGGERIEHRSGGDVLLGPRRYGAITWRDATRHRLAVFCREEAAVIVDYLRMCGEQARTPDEPARIAAALDDFWLERARTAPRRADLGEE